MASGGRQVLLAAQAAAAGDELFISYGGMSPAALLAHYGIPAGPRAARNGSDAAGRPVEAVWRAPDGTVTRRRRVRLPVFDAGGGRTSNGSPLDNGSPLE
jgi:hypothetical protein